MALRNKKTNKSPGTPPGDKYYAVIVAIGKLPDDYALSLKVGDKVISIAAGSIIKIDDREFELYHTIQIDGKLTLKDENKEKVE